MTTPKKATKDAVKPQSELEPGKTYLGDGWRYTVEPFNTKCKHGVGDCEVCGTYERTDRKHTTVGGKGLVARLRDKK